MSNDVDQIKSRLDVVDIVGEYVRLRQSGANWKGLCPFHQEKTPSFMVHREKQIWRCFGCNEGGDIFSFVQKMENIDFPEALELLARKAGVELTRANPAQASQRVRLLQLVAAAATFFSEQLAKSSSAQAARTYIKSRAITADSVAMFGLGYAPPEWDKLLIFLRSQGYSADEVVAAGLGLKSERGPGHYDRFRDRLMFPIADAQGRAVGFGGRTLDPAAKEAKYINSPQGPIYNKSLILYNLDRAKQFIREAGRAVLVEGYMDVVGSWQAGVKNVASVSGTALAPDQVRLMKRYTNEIRIAFDADLAGRSASERGIDLALQAELEVKVIVLPQGKDPDECARQSSAAWREAVEQALPIGDYAFQQALNELDVTTREGKKEAAKRLLTAIAKLPDPVERDFYLKRLVKELQVDERSLRERLQTIAPAAPSVIPTPSQPTQPAVPRSELVAQNLLALLIKFSEHVGAAAEQLDPAMMGTGYPGQLYRRLHVYYTDRHRLDLDELKVELLGEPNLGSLVDQLFLTAEHQYAELTSSEALKEILSLVRDIKLSGNKAEREALSAAIAEVQQAGRQPEQVLLERFAELTRELGNLNK